MITKMSRIVNPVFRTQFGEIICHMCQRCCNIVNSTINTVAVIQMVCTQCTHCYTFIEKDTSAREKNIVMLVFLELERRLNVSVRRETLKFFH